MRLAPVVVGLGFIGLVVVLKLVEITGSTTPFVFALLVLALATAVRIVFSSRPDAPQTVFALLLALTAFCIVIGVDIYRIEGDIERMNTVFKFYLQVWVLLALASAYMLWLILARAQRVSGFAAEGQEDMARLFGRSLSVCVRISGARNS